MSKPMITPLQSIRGFRDIYDKSYVLMERIIQTAIAVVKRYGFSGIELPLLEHTPVFKRSLGDASDIVHKEMYSFLDRNEESLTLRPEGTASLVRAFISNQMMQDLPKRFFYTGPMFRYDRPQKGRYRQFYQFGIECLGVDHPYADYECIKAAVDIFENLGISGYILHLNTLGDLDSRMRFNLNFQDFLQGHKDDLSEDSRIRLITNPLRILDSKDTADQRIVANGPRLKDYLSSESKVFFDQVCTYLTNANIPFQLDDNLVRGLDYYCHTSFEFKHSNLGSQSAFGGGGRYNGLVQLMGGSDISGIGFGLGIDRLMLLLESQPFIESTPIMVIPFGDAQMSFAIHVADLLRQENIICEVSFKGKLAKDLKYAQKRNARHCVLIGPDEMAQKTVTLKHMDGSLANQSIPVKLVASVVCRQPWPS